MGYHGEKIQKELESGEEEERKEDKKEAGDEEEEKREEEEEEEDEEEGDQDEGHRERIIVKGYMRPDGTSYYVVIPKEIRELLGLKGGEYFFIKSKPGKGKIELKLAKFVEE